MNKWLEMPQRWYVELVDHLIKHNPEATIRDFLNVVNPKDKDWIGIFQKNDEMAKERAAERLQQVVKAAHKGYEAGGLKQVKIYELHTPKPLLKTGTND